MKTINVKQYILETLELIDEDLKIGDKALKKRVIDLARTAQEARAAAKKAETNGNSELAAKLIARAEELEELVDTSNVDIIDDEPEDEVPPEEEDTSDEDETDDDSNEDREDDSELDAEDEDDTSEDDSSEEDADDSEEDETTEDDEADDDFDYDSEDDSDIQDNTADDSDSDSVSDTDSDSDDSDTDSEADEEDSSEEDSDDSEDDADEDEEDNESEDNDFDDEDDYDSDLDNEEDTNSADSDASNEDGDESEDNSESDSGDSDEDETESDDELDSDADASAEDTEDTESDEDEEDDNTSGSSSDEEEDSEGDESEEDNENSSSSDKTGSEDEDESDEEEEEDSDAPIKDPFADEEDIPDLPMGSPNGQEPRDATVDDIIKELKGLKGEARKGAIQGLKDLINTRNNSNPPVESFTHKSNNILTEAHKKTVREMTDDEFGDLINSTLDMIEDADNVDYVDDLADRKAKVGAWEKDPLTIAELQAEDNMDLQKERQAKKAREREANKYRNFKSLEQFKINFYDLIKAQVEMVRQEYQSYQEINPEYEGEDIIMKADMMREVPEEAVPVVDVYFDQSGSWREDEIDIGKRAVATIKEFEDSGEIKMNIFYFANNVYSEPGPARAEGGTGAWLDILDNIKATGATNVVIMTDGDMNRSAEYYDVTCKVEGCVWWLWRNGISAPSCTKHLMGKQSNSQYSFNS